MTLQASISVVIPSYNRGAVLLDTINMLLAQDDKAEQILIVDQTHYTDADETAQRLQQLHQRGDINWVQLAKPSIPAAMNEGLKTAKSDYVLFLDDDISIQSDFISQHRIALQTHQDSKVGAHVGQIIQPWQSVVDLGDYDAGRGINKDMAFPFNSNQEQLISNCMAGNLCVARQQAIDIGGFDQQFSQVAYRFETEFCRRSIAITGQLFRFIPSASINHLKVSTGGTRAHAKNYLTSISASHSVGDYYFALQQCRMPGNRWQAIAYILKRPFGSLLAKFYLRQPWWIPVRIVAEFKGLFWAIRKTIKGPIYLS